jgi:hypothetical protein
MLRCARSSRLWLARPVLAVLATSVVVLHGNLASAQSGNQVVRVEEDWEVVVGTPDSTTSGPQITCAISPLGNLGGKHCLFMVNHRTHPSFSAGGTQLQVWNGESLFATDKHPNTALLSTAGETVKWTMKMSLVGGQLIFDVDDGVSTTWDNFGANGLLWEAVESDLANLNGYSPAVSVANSGVNFASNRVQSLVLKKVRLVLSTGEVLEDNTARVVHQLTQ